MRWNTVLHPRRKHLRIIAVITSKPNKCDMAIIFYFILHMTILKNFFSHKMTAHMKPVELEWLYTSPAPHCHTAQLSREASCSHCHFVSSQSLLHAVTKVQSAKGYLPQIQQQICNTKTQNSVHNEQKDIHINILTAVQ